MKALKYIGSVLLLLLIVLLVFGADDFPEGRKPFLSSLYHPQSLSKQSMILVFVKVDGKFLVKVLESDGLTLATDSRLMQVDALQEPLTEIFYGNVHHLKIRATWIKGAASDVVAVFPLVSNESYPDAFGLAVFGIEPKLPGFYTESRKRLDASVVPYISATLGPDLSCDSVALGKKAECGWKKDDGIKMPGSLTEMLWVVYLDLRETSPFMLYLLIFIGSPALIYIGGRHPKIAGILYNFLGEFWRYRRIDVTKMDDEALDNLALKKRKPRSEK